MLLATALEASRNKAIVNADVAEAKELGVRGTPAFFINGRFLSGAEPLEEFASLIDPELSRLKVPVPVAAAGSGD